MKIKIFCIYHKPYHLFSSDAVEPIQTGCAEATEDLKILRDDEGDNISHKNKNYGELSAWYWVWKNYLPKHPEIDYVGFCHYRRFLNFTPKKYKSNWNKVYFETFSKAFKKYYNLKNIRQFLNADIILPKITKFRKVTLRESYDRYHPTTDMVKMIEIVQKRHPQYHSLILDTLNERQGYFCLNFIMKRPFFISFMEWVFPLLTELEKECDWSEYKEYENIRTPAYLMERFFNVWLNIQKVECSPVISEMHSILLVNKPSLLKRLVIPFLFLIPKKKREAIKDNWYNQ